MEERKLNFSAPLLSVRRISTTKAATEGVKGKELEKSQISKHRTLPSYSSEAHSEQVTEPVAVPFHWEQTPGIRKDGSVPPLQPGELVSSSQRLESRRIFDVLKQRVEKKSTSRSMPRHQTVVDSCNAGVRNLDCSKDRVTVESFVSSGYADDGEDIYTDALEILSPTESFSVICSASGVSNYENVVVEASGTFSTDKQVQEFMMSRFLPAAKAMALKPSVHSLKKQLVAAEQERQIVKVVTMERKPPTKRIEVSIVPYTGQDIGNYDSEDEYDEHESSISVHIPTKACGILPRLCFKNSLSILNPISGMKARNQACISSPHESVKSSKGTSSRSQSPIRRFLSMSSSKSKQENATQSPRLFETASKLKFGSNRFNSGGERPSMSRTSSPLRRSGVLSPNRNRSTPQSPIRSQGTGHSGIPKDAEHARVNKVPCYKGSKSQELFPHHVNKQWSCPIIPAIEKTLYIDTVNKAQNSCQASGKDLDGSLKSRVMEAMTDRKSPLRDGNCIQNLERKGNARPAADHRHVKEVPEQNSKALVCVGTTTKDGHVAENGLTPKEDGTKSIIAARFIESPALPLLPKTPSESWLWRTLPSLYSRKTITNVQRGASFQSKMRDSKTPSAESKWENIVKSSYSHHDHVRYSEELISQSSKQWKG